MSVVDSLTKTLQSNSSLKELRISPSHFFTEQDVCALITSLEKNYSLQVLKLPMGVSDNVFRAIMDMLLVNKTLKKIDWWYYRSFQEGKRAVLEQELKKNAIVYEESMSLLKDLPMVKATSARVFLCGYPFAGKNWCTKASLNK
jgi:GTP1/Obg family GTP-binding protein